MFDFFGFDPSTMSDDQLMQKRAEISRKMNYAARFSNHPEMVDQMALIIESIDMVRRERMMVMMAEARKKISKEIIETDPDLVVRDNSASEAETAEAALAERRKANRQRMITRPAGQTPFQKSSKPISET